MQPTGYVHNAAVLCPKCAANLDFPFFDRDMGVEIASEDQMNVVFSWNETDSVQSCDNCQETIDTTVIG
jgi:hypothetical protein